LKATFATVRHRHDPTKAACQQDRARAMVCKLLKDAQKNWRLSTATTQLPKTRFGVNQRRDQVHRQADRP